MKTYERPLVFTNEELFEGVYACTSGDTNKCMSIYMKGVFHPNTRSQHIINPGNDPDSLHQKYERGCEGCPYNWGESTGCAINFSNAWPGQDSRPWWEKSGYKDTDPY